MTHLGLRDWEWMLRTAAPSSEHTDPYDEFSDIWQGSRGGTNPAAEQWLNDRVRYERGDTSQNPLSPHNWVGRPEEPLPVHGDYLQYNEANRSIDDDHDAFRSALRRGLEADSTDYGQFGLVGQRPQAYEPTSPERLASDEGWLLGPGRQFNYPGGRDSIESIHNGMHQRGFDLQNAGTDENPVPSYVHQDTHATIRPSGDAWSMRFRGDTTDHANPASAAAHHQNSVTERNANEAVRWQSSRSRDSGRSYLDDASTTPTAPSVATPSRRETHYYIPKTKAKGMSWHNLFDQAINGNDGHGREFERASVKSVHNPHSNDTGRLYGVHQDQWDKDFENERQGRGVVAQAIYHYQTPIAWKYHEAQPDGNYGEGTWRLPATGFGSTGFFKTQRVQSLMSGAFRGTNHESLIDPLVSHDLHRAMEDGGLRRQDDQSYRVVDAHGNTHNIAPSYSGKTAVHTVTSQDGTAFAKRVPVREAATTAFTMTQSPGAGGPPDPMKFLRDKKYRQTAGDVPPPARRRRDVPLRLQPELPFRNSSVASWSQSLRD